MQTFKFSKMHGAGNDYIYVNCFKEKVENINETAKAVSDRHFGIGSDGLVLIWLISEWICTTVTAHKLKCAETQRVVSVSMCTTEVLQTRHRLLLKRWRV